MQSYYRFPWQARLSGNPKVGISVAEVSQQYCRVQNVIVLSETNCRYKKHW